MPAGRSRCQRIGLSKLPVTGERSRGVSRPRPGGREVAGDAGHAQAIGPVGRHLDVDQRIVEPHDLGEGRADGRVVGQLDDAVMILAQPHLALGAEHAVGFDAADHPGLELQPGAGNVAADRREDALHAGARIGRAADHLDLAAAGIDQADPQPVGIGMLLGLHDIADGEGREIAGADPRCSRPRGRAPSAGARYRRWRPRSPDAPSARRA